jgi:hypothetical protein
MVADHDRKLARVCSPAPLADIGTSVSGTFIIDASADVCRWVQRRCSGDAMVICGSLFRLPLPSRIVDEFAVPAYTLQTLTGSLQMLEEIRRVLKPDVGRLRTWWLLWPNAIRVPSAECVVSCAGLRSTYRVADDVLTIERDDGMCPEMTEREGWRILAARRDEVNIMLSEVGFKCLDWFDSTRTDFDGLTVGGVECRA